MNEPTWKGHVLYSNNRVLGWIGYEPSSYMWFARTSGTLARPSVRGEFDNEHAARDFLQFITSVENTYE